MNRLLFFAILASFIFSSCADESAIKEMKTPFESSDSIETTTYEEAIDWWRALEKESAYFCLKEFGETDAGLPLHLIVINSARNFNFESIQKS